MGHVFISYSSEEKDYADTIKEEFNKNGIKTWMAPGDIPAGSSYAGVIINALKEADALVLLLTENSQKSVFVDKEVERAINYRKTIIPIALENVKLNDSFEFYLGNQQIVQVRQLNDKNPELAKIIRQLKVLTSDTTAVKKDVVNKKESVSQPTDSDLARKKECQRILDEINQQYGIDIIHGANDLGFTANNVVPIMAEIRTWTNPQDLQRFLEAVKRRAAEQ